jgi:NAD(P)-dependent dehydrogenase (short-subunit alcohol dehydrogenase family)
VQADLTTHEGIESFIETVLAEQEFDVIINNAGLSSVEDDMDIDAWERVLRINSIVPALVMAHATELLSMIMEQ